MTAYPDAAVARPQVSRPGAVLATVGVALVSAIAGIVQGVMYLAGGRDLAMTLAAEAIASATGGTADSVKAEGGFLLDAGVEEVQNTLQGRAIIAIAFGALLLVVGLLMLGASVWSRVLGILAALLNAGISLRIATDAEGGTAAIHGVAWAAVVTGLAVIVLTWLPANNRYAKARKAR